jgi:hypothetical protein
MILTRVLIPYINWSTGPFSSVGRGTGIPDADLDFTIRVIYALESNYNNNSVFSIYFYTYRGW